MFRRRSFRIVLLAGVVGLPLFLLHYSGVLPWVSLRWLYSAIVSEAGVTVERNVEYGPHRRQRLDVYRPRHNGRSGPIIIFLYGGGWKTGRRENYGFVGAAFASRGITTVIPDYRLYPEVYFPTFVADAALAYAWVWRNVAARGEESRPIVLLGHSAGAHIAALLSLDSEFLAKADPNAPRPSAFVGLAGPFAFDPTTWPSTKNIFAKVTIADKARPITFANDEAPPSLLIHGLDDTTVRLWNTRSMAKALAEAGARTRKIEYDGVGHIGLIAAISRPFRWRAPVLRDVVNFVREAVN